MIIRVGVVSAEGHYCGSGLKGSLEEWEWCNEVGVAYRGL